MDLDAATVLLQWATGGLAFTWVTTRRREVGIGYGWLMRGVYLVLAGLAVVAGRALSPDGWGAVVRDAGAVAVALGAAVALGSSVRRRKVGVAGEHERRARRAERVSAMVGKPDTPPDGAVEAQRDREFDPRLDLIAPVAGAVGLIGAASVAGGEYGLSLARVVIGAAFLGAVTDAMLLGHWYLVQPGLGRAPLLEMNRWIAVVWPFEVGAMLWGDAPGVHRNHRRRVGRLAGLGVAHLCRDHHRSRRRRPARPQRALLLGGDGSHRPALPGHPHRLRHRPRGSGGAGAVTAPAAAPRRGQMSSAPTWILVAALAAAVAAVHLITGWHSEGPVVFDDEGGYLRIARHLAGEGPEAGVRYFPGYSLLVAPIHWALGSTWAIFLGVKVLNAGLGAAFVVVAFLTTGYLLPREERWKRLGATALVSLYPSFLLFSNQALSENALTTLSMVLAYLVARWLPGRVTWPAAAGLGALGANALVVHPRSVGVAVALSAVIAACWWPWRPNARRVLAFAAGLIVVGVVGVALVQWERTGAPSGSGTYRLGEIVGDRGGLEGLRRVAVGAAGQALYLVVTTAGMIVLGGLQVGKAVGRAWRERDRSTPTVLVLYAGLASLLVFVTSAVFISPAAGSARPDAVLYGRYNEGLVAPLLLVGATALVSGRFRLWDRERWWRGVLPWLVGSVGVTALAVEWWQQDQLLGVHVENPFNVLALYPVLAAMGGVEPLALAAVGVAAAAAFLSVARRHVGLAVGLALVAFLGLAMRMAFFNLPRDHYDPRAQERVVAETVNAIDARFGVECVGADRARQPIYHVQLYRWYIDDARIVEFSSDVGEPDAPCGSLVVSGRADLHTSYPGARLVTREGRDVESYLWVLPGELQEQLEVEGRLS